MSVVFLGDVYIPQPYLSTLNFDKFVFNLEHPITQSTNPAHGTVNLKAEKEYMSRTFNSVPSAVCLANNHIMDYGEKGLSDTLKSLEELGISYFGAGFASDNYGNPATIEVDGERIALFGYADQNMAGVATRSKDSGVSPLDIKNFQHEVEKIGKDIRIVVQVHWGAEEVHYPRPDDVQLARKLIDSGADLVIGHHSHCIQPWENYKNKKIFYGLGNCIMPDICSQSHFSDKNKSGRPFCKIQNWWNKRSIGVEYNPENNESQFIPLKFTGGQLKNGSIKRDLLRAKIFQSVCESDNYEVFYRVSHIYGKVRTVGINYLRNPSFITLKDFKDLWKLMQGNE